MRNRLLAGLAGIGLAAGALLTAAPASAATYGSVHGSFCGAAGTFKTINTVPQVRLIVDHAGRATAAHNGGCFGITPGGRIYYTSATHPKWKVIPGNGIAVQTVGSFLGNACPPTWACVADALPTVRVKTGSGAYYEQTYWSDGWGGKWVRG